MKINTTMKLVFSAIGVGMAITMATVFQLDSLEQQVDRLSLIVINLTKLRMSYAKVPMT